MRPILILASFAVVASGQNVTFLRDVAPILNKAGCTSGPCHGAAKGKNGFKLSLRGYDPQFDYQALLYDLSGRRFNRSEPKRSLMLAKPVMQVAHGGGLRFEQTSAYY
ncbi:MAG: cell surface protein, partial [Acidobacteria bacterium]|nr:cell surface protein [Acidobacteriota bacterium]